MVSDRDRATRGNRDASCKRSASPELEFPVEDLEGAYDLANNACRNVFRRGRSREDYEDLTQETVIRALVKGHQYDPSRSAFSTWLYWVARTVCNGDHRAKERRPEDLFTELGSFTPDGSDIIDKQRHEPSPEDVLIRREEAKAEKTLLKHLIDESVPPMSRGAFKLRLAGFSYAEIAEELGVPMGTVKIRIHRAMKKLGI
jgi:RNA polymerase sigma-70 factor (ECF subfamily)